MTSSGEQSASRAIAAERIPFTGRPEDLPDAAAVGGKAHNLMRLDRCGLTVPPAFVLTTGLCRDYMARGDAALTGLDRALAGEMDRIGEVTGRHFGDARRPLLVSVRSGAAVSMPGMMETVLNIGLNRSTARGLTRLTGNPRLAPDCRRRLVQQFAEVVHGVPPAPFDAALAAALAAQGIASESELDTPALHRLAETYMAVFESETGRDFPENPFDQLRAAVIAVLRSWSSDRARTYRKINDIPDDMGTATLVQTMVFGNTGPSSGSGVGFTRSPADGGNSPFIDFLPNAQGEDVVAGRRRALGFAALGRRAPAAGNALLDAISILEREFADMQDFEFTVEAGRLFLLQTRTGKRTPLAALRIACDLVEEGLITPADALARLDGLDIETIDIGKLEPSPDQMPVALGVPAGAGVTVGAAVFDPERIPALGRDRPLVLLRPTAETHDIKALSLVDALITAEGARTSHAAVVARQLDKTCVVGCTALSIDESGRWGTLGDTRIEEGDVLSVDGTSGEIYYGEVALVRDRPTDLLDMVRLWRQELPAPVETAAPR